MSHNMASKVLEEKKKKARKPKGIPIHTLSKTGDVIKIFYSFYIYPIIAAF